MPAGKFLWDSTFEITVRRLVEIDAEIRWEGIVEQLRGQEDEDGSESDDVDPDDLRTAAACFSGGAHIGGDFDCEMDGTADDPAPRMGSGAHTHTAALARFGTQQHDVWCIAWHTACLLVLGADLKHVQSMRRRYTRRDRVLRPDQLTN